MKIDKDKKFTLNCHHLVHQGEVNVRSFTSLKTDLTLGEANLPKPQDNPSDSSSVAVDIEAIKNCHVSTYDLSGDCQNVF